MAEPVELSKGKYTLNHLSGRLLLEVGDGGMQKIGVVDKDDALKRKYDIRIIAERKTQLTLQRMQKDFLNSINAYSLVLVLLATVTYVGFLQPPGGFDGSYLQDKSEMSIFIYFNSFSFYFSVADLLLCVCSSLSPLTSITTVKENLPVLVSGGHVTLQTEQITTKHLAQFVASTLVKLIFVNGLFAISLVCCVAGYAAAGFVVTTGDSGARVSVLISSIAGLTFFFIFMVWLLRDTLRFLSKAVNDESLSTSLQNRAGSLQVQFQYLNAGLNASGEI